MAFEAVFESKGGLFGAGSAGQLPRGATQAYNMKRALQQKELVADSCPRCPSYLLQVLEICCSLSWSNVRLQRRSTGLFKMLHVLQSRWLFFVLINNSRTLIDSAVTPFGFVFGVDPTFNLGDFSVTPVVYQHLLLENPKTSQSLLLLGPMLVRYCKLFQSYHYFFLTLIGLKPSISGVQETGTGVFNQKMVR